jgi:alcohol dehydrogenase class IV
MATLLPIPKLVLGTGQLRELRAELAAQEIHRPLLISDAGIDRAGLVARVAQHLPDGAVVHARVAENPTCADADAAFGAYSAGACDGIVALGGGSVLDTAKFVAGMVHCGSLSAAQLLGKSDLIGPGVAPLIALPTTVGTGSESSPATGLHPDARTRAVGTRSPFLIPRVVLCDPLLAASLPPRLIAATGIDALSHCLEGYLAQPANPIADAIALDGLGRAFRHVKDATRQSIDALEMMMAASFAGGVAIHKGLGPAHAIAVACGDQDLHHGALVAAVLPAVMQLMAARAPEKARRAAQAMGLAAEGELAGALADLIRALGLPTSLRELGYRVASFETLVEAMCASPFNRSAPYAPTPAEYLEITRALTA